MDFSYILKLLSCREKGERMKHFPFVNPFKWAWKGTKLIMKEMWKEMLR